jgi:hypothetical protein
MNTEPPGAGSLPEELPKTPNMQFMTGRVKAGGMGRAQLRVMQDRAGVRWLQPHGMGIDVAHVRWIQRIIAIACACCGLPAASLAALNSLQALLLARSISS